MDGQGREQQSSANPRHWPARLVLALQGWVRLRRVNEMVMEIGESQLVKKKRKSENAALQVLVILTGVAVVCRRRKKRLR